MTWTRLCKVSASLDKHRSAQYLQLQIWALGFTQGRTHDTCTYCMHQSTHTKIIHAMIKQCNCTFNDAEAIQISTYVSKFLSKHLGRYLDNFVSASLKSSSWSKEKDHRALTTRVISHHSQYHFLAAEIVRQLRYGIIIKEKLHHIMNNTWLTATLRWLVLFIKQLTPNSCIITEYQHII